MKITIERLGSSRTFTAEIVGSSLGGVEVKDENDTRYIVRNTGEVFEKITIAAHQDSTKERYPKAMQIGVAINIALEK